MNGIPAALPLSGLGPHLRQYARRKMDLECDRAVCRYVEFEINKGQLLDLIRDFDVLVLLGRYYPSSDE